MQQTLFDDSRIIKFHEPPPITFNKSKNINYNDFVKVYGKYIDNNLCLLAIKFKTLVININNIDDIQNIPNGTVVILPKFCPNISNDSSRNLLIYRIQNKLETFDNDESIVVQNNIVSTLLSAFFKPGSIKCKEFCRETLFVLTTHNPFTTYTELRKCRSFLALKKFSYIFLYRQPLFYRDLFYLRFFKQYKSNEEPLKFNTWSNLAYKLINLQFSRLFPLQYPSAYFGKFIHTCHLRAKSVKDPLNPTDLYQCNILLDDDCLVGIAFIIDKENVVTYISPMIVSFQTNEYLDTNRILCYFLPAEFNPEVCQNWIPLYKNKRTWEEKGFLWYLQSGNINKLDKVLSWLYVQKSEIFRQIYRDVALIHYILSEKSQLKWPLNHWYDELSKSSSLENSDVRKQLLDF